MVQLLRLTMTLLVRNEEDILEDNVWFHHLQGVDSFIIMDNLSSDRTADIIRSLAKELEIEHLTQSDDTYSQSQWLTDMAKVAARTHKADWIIHNDADEFWQAQNGTIKDFLSSMSPEVGVIKVKRHNAVLRRDKSNPLHGTMHPRETTLFETLSLNNHGLPVPPKCAHRASDAVEVLPGNHNVRGVNGKTVEDTQALRILHFPYRSFPIYKRKITLGGGAYARNKKTPPDVGATWRQHHEALKAEGLETFWTAMCVSDSDVLLGRLDGSIFKDRSIADMLRERSEKLRGEVVEKALADLVEKTQSKVDEFIAAQTSLLAQIPQEVRRQRPLYYNLQFCVSGPERHLEKVKSITFSGRNLAASINFSYLRDVYSLFPQNEGIIDFMAALLLAHFPDDVRRIRSDFAGRKIILHVTCGSRRHLAQSSVQSFAGLGPDYHHVLLIGSDQETTEDQTDLSFRYDGEVLIVPVPDNYENLHRKIFYALTIIDLVAEPSMVIKVDDNLHLGSLSAFRDTISSLAADDIEYAGRLIGTDFHQLQWHGWHLTKCSNPLIETRGYQYPLPRRYAAGGFGYFLGKHGIRACSYMYLAMKQFFNLDAVGLEDAYVGHAMYAQNIELHDTSSEANLLAFPGLVSREADGS